jgi:hypothetical protein
MNRILPETCCYLAAQSKLNGYFGRFELMIGIRTAVAYILLYSRSDVGSERSIVSRIAVSTQVHATYFPPIRLTLPW